MAEGDGLERCDTGYAPQRMEEKIHTGGNERHILV